MFIFLGFFIVTGQKLSTAMLILPFVYVVQQILAFALGFLLAQLTVFIRDLKEFTAILMQLWFWFTPIVYVVSIVPSSLSEILVYNPVYQIINIWHQVFVYQTIPDMTGIIVITVAAHALLFITFLMYRILEKDIRDFL